MKGEDVLFENEEKLERDRLYKGVRRVKVGKRVVGSLYRSFNDWYDFYSEGNRMVAYTSFEKARTDIVRRFSEVDNNG